MKPSKFFRMRASLFRFLDCNSGELKGLAAQLIDGRPQLPRDQANTYSNAQLQRPHSPSQVKQESRYLVKFAGDRLKLIPRGHGIRQPNSLFLKMSNRRDSKFSAEYGPH